MLYYLYYKTFENGKSSGVTKQEFPAKDDRQAESKAKRYIEGRNKVFDFYSFNKTIKLIKLVNLKGQIILGQPP